MKIDFETWHWYGSNDPCDHAYTGIQYRLGADSALRSNDDGVLKVRLRTHGKTTHGVRIDLPEALLNGPDENLAEWVEEKLDWFSYSYGAWKQDGTQYDLVEVWGNGTSIVLEKVRTGWGLETARR